MLGTMWVCRRNRDCIVINRVGIFEGKVSDGHNTWGVGVRGFNVMHSFISKTSMGQLIVSSLQMWPMPQNRSEGWSS